jgi:hypothetical protein
MEFLEQNEATLETPESFHAIKNKDFKLQLKENWEAQFNKTGVFFDQWLPTINSLFISLRLWNKFHSRKTPKSNMARSPVHLLRKRPIWPNRLIVCLKYTNFWG